MIAESIARSIAEPIACVPAVVTSGETFRFLTEGGDTFVTESGDPIKIEEAP